MSIVLYVQENTRGFTEKIRMLLQETGMKYEEVAIDMETAKSWAKSGKINFPNLPVLEMDGVKIEHADAILEHLADVADQKKLGQGGNKYCGEPQERPVIRGLACMVRPDLDPFDLRFILVLSSLSAATRRSHRIPARDAYDPPTQVKDFQNEVQTYKGKTSAPPTAPESIERWFEYFQSILERNDDGDVKTDEFLYGKHLTFADIALFEAVNAVINVHGLKAIRAFPKLKEFHDKVAYRARIERHIATRPEAF
ncbi:uncharacterized protein MONBRDRAFT_38057 [Monosiga brevicollis MX1]|uniref:Glutathione transferase n=1 Tax=Monosiga brevicollis TaxID=81824 RepID=A9V5G2_MONBE|nr:uncharacterized protein MONBRDRAFT_38057 [Monosiga brevicollis MX1]EDQ87365.1 predicted protein [Monosiga brevicollis MX1]|eukprot:XP_001747978.1 hypothetical protein [Monosiga brevicollis MX1]